jgi:hypothetical protein
MTKLPLLVLCIAGAALPTALLAACATDNGDSVHGPQFGPPPERPDGGAPDGSVVGEGGGPTSDGSTDGGADVDSAPPPPCAAGTVAVLAGSDSTLSGAVQINGGAWTGAAITGGAALSAPTLLAFGTGFVGLTRGPSDVLQSVSYGASWSGVTAVGSLKTLGTPGLAALGANAQAVYLSGSAADVNKFSRIQNGGASWSTTGDPVMPPLPAGTQSFGPSAGAIAAAGADLVFAQAGGNELLYTQKWDGAVWAPAAPITGAGTFNTVSPALVSVPGKFDLVLLYADKTAPHVIGFATRDATTAWSSATVTQATAQTGEAMSAALVSPTSVVVMFRGNDGKAYTMTGTLGAAVSWSVPALLLADGSVTVDSAPAVAKGVCGDDAVAVFASGGQVKATHLRAGAWSVPGPVAGASGTRVSVATR